MFTSCSKMTRECLSVQRNANRSVLQQLSATLFSFWYFVQHNDMVGQIYPQRKLLKVGSYFFIKDLADVALLKKIDEWILTYIFENIFARVHILSVTYFYRSFVWVKILELSSELRASWNLTGILMSTFQANTQAQLSFLLLFHH